MLNSGKKIRALRDKQKIFELLWCPKTKILNEANNHSPTPHPFKLNGRSQICVLTFASKTMQEVLAI
jgi:hypothetical protein